MRSTLSTLDAQRTTALPASGYHLAGRGNRRPGRASVVNTAENEGFL